MKEKPKTLTIYYHCHASCPQLVTYCDIVDSLEDYKYPAKETPVIVSLNQEIPYLNADLEERTTIKTIRYIVGKVEPADMTLNFNFDYEAEEFLEKYPESKVINYTSPNGKSYIIPKTDCTRAFDTEEDLKKGVDAFVTRFLGLKEKDKEKEKTTTHKESPKTYVKRANSVCKTK